MAQIETVTAPLVLRLNSGEEKVIARAFPHAQGLLYLDTFWHLSTPDQAAHLIRGELRGEGPWRVGDAVLRVLGCAHTDPALLEEFARWNDYLIQNGDQYPGEEQIVQIARRLGAVI